MSEKSEFKFRDFSFNITHNIFIFNSQEVNVKENNSGNDHKVKENQNNQLKNK